MVEAANYPAKLGPVAPSTERLEVLRQLAIKDCAMRVSQPIDRSVSPQDVVPSSESPASLATSNTERDSTLPGVPFSFGPALPQPCSVSRCAAGHEWVPQLRIAQCPGCGAPMLVLLMQNCPACNEPTAGSDLRLDHMPQASGQLLPICRGSATMAEAIKIELKHSHAADEQREHVVRDVVSKV